MINSYRTLCVGGALTSLLFGMNGAWDNPAATAPNATALAVTPPSVTTMRVPEGGIQPEIAVDSAGTVHLVYFKGDPKAGDLFYVKSADGGTAFSKPIQINSQAGSAMAVGSVRGSQLALGANNRVHIAWNGSGSATPKGPKNESPLLYARLNDEGTAFEPQRNLMQRSLSLDGGGAVAADGKGTVYAVWHATDPDGRDGEPYRRIWIAQSRDDGKSFDAERIVAASESGACACCGASAFIAKDGGLYVLYRSANEAVHRDMHLVFSADGGAHATDIKLADWNAGQCVLSTAAFTECASGVLAAWETQERVYCATIDAATHQPSKPVAPESQGRNAKHPVIAADRDGNIIMAWTAGTTWGKGGEAAWQVFDKSGKPQLAENGHAAGLPVWGMVAVFARPAGGFVVVY